MSCPRCGTELPSPGFASDTPLHTDARCAEVLKGKLAKAELWIENLHSVLTDHPRGPCDRLFLKSAPGRASCASGAAAALVARCKALEAERDEALDRMSVMKRDHDETRGYRQRAEDNLAQCHRELSGCRRKDEALTRRVEYLEEALGIAKPWPVVDVLRRLASGANHLLNEHACDQHGYEEMGACAQRAYDYAGAIEKALAASHVTRRM